jgi:hypothetical protein
MLYNFKTLMKSMFYFRCQIFFNNLKLKLINTILKKSVCTAKKTQFFTDHYKDEVVMLFRKIPCLQTESYEITSTKCTATYCQSRWYT